MIIFPYIPSQTQNFTNFLSQTSVSDHLYYVFCFAPNFPFPHSIFVSNHHPSPIPQGQKGRDKEWTTSKADTRGRRELHQGSRNNRVATTTTTTTTTTPTTANARPSSAPPLRPPPTVSNKHLHNDRFLPLSVVGVTEGLRYYNHKTRAPGCVWVESDRTAFSATKSRPGNRPLTTPGSW